MMKQVKLCEGIISDASFGIVQDRPYLFGLRLQFSLPYSTFCYDDGRYLCNLNFPEESNKLYKISSLLEEARVKDIKELIGIKVLVALSNNRFEDFQVMQPLEINC